MGLSGSVIQQINHGISTGALFLIVGVLYERRHTRLIAEFGGLSTPMPSFAAVYMIIRSEEHTSELQSLAYLVCRLLLEKKKHKVHYARSEAPPRPQHALQDPPRGERLVSAHSY